MSKILYCLIIMLSFTNASAEWVVVNEVVSLNTQTAQEISINLPLFPSALASLNSENLTSSSRVIVKSILGNITNYRWENDSSCKVSNPSSIKEIQLSNIKVAFIYEANPEETWFIENREFPVLPCRVGDRVKRLLTKSK